MRLAEAHPEWAMGFEDEVWWSRFEQSAMHSWMPSDEPLRLVEQPVAKQDKEPKALACYGLSVRLQDADGNVEERMWLRFVGARPVSPMTTRFLSWCCDKLQALGKTALLLVWDNASWHKSREVMGWIKEHNRAVRQRDRGVRILPCLLPSKSPWLNPIEPKWMQGAKRLPVRASRRRGNGKRRVAEPDRLLSAAELERRVYDCFDCDHQDHLSIAQQAA